MTGEKKCIECLWFNVECDEFPCNFCLAEAWYHDSTFYEPKS